MHAVTTCTGENCKSIVAWTVRSKPGFPRLTRDSAIHLRAQGSTVENISSGRTEYISLHQQSSDLFNSVLMVGQREFGCFRKRAQKKSAMFGLYPSLWYPKRKDLGPNIFRVNATA